MHERTRRNLCRLAFLALAVLPTLGTVTWIGYRESPLYAFVQRSEWERRLFDWTGMHVRVEQMEFPGGGSLLFHRLTLTDPDGGAPAATVRQMELAYHPQGIVVLLSQPEVAQGKFLRLWDVLEQRVLQGPRPGTAVQITSGEVTLEVGSRAQTFTTVRCTVEPFENNVRAWLEFQLAGVPMPGPAQLRIERHRQLATPATSWSLHSDTPLPCHVFTDYLPPLARFGDRASFQGTVSCMATRDGWSSEVAGRLLQVDLSRLTEDLPHRLSGDATIVLDRVVFDRGLVHSATGSVVSTGGTVSRSLITALAEHIPLSAPEVMLAASTPLTNYDRLAFRFTVAADGFALSGLDPGAGDVLLTVGGQPLLAGDRTVRYPLVSLVRALAPDSVHLVPATEITKPLLQLFTFPAPTGESAPRLRLSERPRE
jgi:hypothetical protein